MGATDELIEIVPVVVTAKVVTDISRSSYRRRKQRSARKRGKL